MAKENSTTNPLCDDHVVSSNDDQSPEESGWTIYFEDFLSNNTTQHMTTCFSSADDIDQSFTVADAASSVANCKLSSNNNERAAAAAASGFRYRDMRCSFKKRKMKDLMVADDSLEDTASSPANSPKVSDSTYFSKNQKQKENLPIPQENGFISEQIDHSREMGFVELKKRGLCLVPLSMVVNYLAE